jgi:hypothetical protein
MPLRLGDCKGAGLVENLAGRRSSGHPSGVALKGAKLTPSRVKNLPHTHVAANLLPHAQVVSNLSFRSVRLLH